MALPQSLVAHQALSRRTGLPRVLLAAALCTFLVVLACGFLSHSPLSAPTSLFLRDGVPNDREIEFESTVAQHQGAKASLTPVPPNVLKMFERALDEQKNDLDAQPLEGDYVDNTLSMHRDAESKVMQLACKMTPDSRRCKLIAAARAARAASKAKSVNDAKAKQSANEAKAKLAAEQMKAQLKSKQDKEIAAAVAKATAAASAKLRAAQEEIAKAKKQAAEAKKQAAAELKAAQALADAKIKAAEAKAQQALQKAKAAAAPPAKAVAQKKASASASSKGAKK